jgi:tetratricopeptide (TPR) repeat protein
VPVAAATVWSSAVDRYLAGDRAAAGAIVLRTPATDLTSSSERAFEGWRVPPAGDTAARRSLIRSLQISALMPLELMVTASGRTLTLAHERALADTSREAWRRLAAFDGDDDDPQAAAVLRFRTRWRLAFLQHLIASSQFAEATREANATNVPDDDREALAALALLRGLALETRARLADEAPSANVAMSMRRLPPVSRLSPMLLTLDDAGKAYRRALEFAPGDRESTLRLARVAIERARLDDATRLLEPLLEASCREPVCGLAYLFMGEIHEARNEPDRAASAYARASSVASVRHSALIAMMQLSLRRGNARAAYDLTRQFSTPVALALRQAPDAWPSYTGGRLVEATRILEAMSAAVVK